MEVKTFDGHRWPFQCHPMLLGNILKLIWPNLSLPVTHGDLMPFSGPGMCSQNPWLKGHFTGHPREATWSLHLEVVFCLRWNCTLFTLIWTPIEHFLSQWLYHFFQFSDWFSSALRSGGNVLIMFFLFISQSIYSHCWYQQHILGICGKIF